MKKGFTLIELLAVIVILAIIALIATPIVLNIINDSKKEARERSIDNIIHTARIYAAKEGLEENRAVHIKDIKNMIDGEKPENGIIYFDKNGEVAFSLDFKDEVYVKSFEGEIIKEDQVYTLKVEDTPNSPEIPFLYGPKTRVQIETVVFVPTNKVPDEIKEIEKNTGEKRYWDVTDTTNQSETGKVMAWYTDADSNGLYEVYIGQDGGVKANPNSAKLFNNLINVKEIDLTYLNTEYATNMKCMFQDARSLTKIDVSNFDTSKVTNMVKMFGVSTNNYMSLEQIIGLNSFDTSEVTNMRAMFQNCISLTEIDVSSFDTSKVTNMAFMFAVGGTTNAPGYDEFDPQPMKLERIIGIENFDTSSVGTELEENYSNGMAAMFQYCSNLTILDLSKWDTSKVTDMSYMFNYTTKLETIYIGNKWHTASITTAMFNGSASNESTLIVK